MFVFCFYFITYSIFSWSLMHAEIYCGQTTILDHSLVSNTRAVMMLNSVVPNNKLQVDSLYKSKMQLENQLKSLLLPVVLLNIST